LGLFIVTVLKAGKIVINFAFLKSFMLPMVDSAIGTAQILPGSGSSSVPHTA
jgi:hypothetical protein